MRSPSRSFRKGTNVGRLIKSAIRHRGLRYLRRFSDLKQVDWEFTVAQMLCLCLAPQKVYEFVEYRKQTKNTRSRDDPGFVILLILLMLGTSLAYLIAFKVPINRAGSFLLALVLPVLFYLGIGFVVSTASYLLIKHQSQIDTQSTWTSDVASFIIRPLQATVGLPSLDARASQQQQMQQQDGEGEALEWAYCFDVHSDGTLPLFLLCGVTQFLMLPLLLFLLPSRLATLLSNLLYGVAGLYYWYIASIAYSRLPFFRNVVLMLYPVVVVLAVLLLFTLLNISMTRIYLTLTISPFL